MPYFRFRKKNIFYNDSGQGSPVVLLHGFTESSKIWEEFAGKLERKYRVIAPDLPGHGKSDSVAPVHDMELMADMVAGLLKRLKTGKCLLAGHSMGGYVALSFAEKYPGMLKGLTLFHSHCYADTKDETEIRNRTIQVVKNDKFGFVAQFIPGLFPEASRKLHAAEIGRMVRRAAKMEGDAVVAALEGMKARKDHTRTLQNLPVPVLFILGMKDSRAPVARFNEMTTLPAVTQSLVIRDCGHMGFIEFPRLTFGALAGFAKTILG